MSTEIRNGLIGVGLINVEDRSGVLSLDKGKSELFSFFLSLFLMFELYVNPAQNVLYCY